MNLFALSGLLTGLTSASLGTFVYLKNRQSVLNRIWAVFAFAVAIWGFGVYKIASTTDIHMALIWWRVTHVGVIAIPVLFFHFVRKFVEHRRKSAIVAVYLIGLAFLVSDATDLFIKNMRFVFSSFYYDSPPGPIYPLFVLFFFGTVIYSHYELWKAYQQSTAQRRNQIKYFFLATGVGFAGGGTCFLPVFGFDVYPLLNFTVPLYPIIMTYAIVKYRLMDISVVLHKGLAYALLLCLIFAPTFLGVAISQRATLYAIPPLLAGALVFACGLWIVFKSPKAVTNITFGLTCLGVCLWLFGAFMLYSARSGNEALLWGKLIFIGIVYIPAFFYHFAASFLQRPTHKRQIWINYLISSAFFCLIPTHYFTDGQYSYFWGTYPRAGPLYPFFMLYFATASVLALRSLYLGYKAKERTAPLEATRIKYIFWAFVVGYLASVDFAQNYGLQVYPVGFLFVSLWIGLVTYAIVRYQLLDISVIVSRAQLLPYGQVLALIAFYGAVLTLMRLFTGAMHYVLAGVLVAIAAIFAELFVTLQKRMEKVVEKALFRKRYNAYETLTEFSNAMVKMLDLRALNEKIIATLANVMGAKNVSLFLLDKEKNDYFLAIAHGLDEEQLRAFRIRENNPFVQYLKETDQPIVKEEWERHHPVSASKGILSALSMMESDLCIPLKNKERLVGLLNLGPKINRRMYSPEDLNLLATLAQNAAIALDNAALYEELKRSQILIRRTDRLRSLETMAGGFAHEIRNPLTSIKTFIQLAPDRRDDQEFFGHFSRLVYEDLARIERLIQEILDYARYMEPKFMEENLNEVVSSCLYFVEVKAESKAIILAKELAPDLPPVMLDRQQIKQVLLNLFLNALDALGDTGGRVTVRTHRLTKQARDAWVQIEVADTGCGIAQADLDHIFDPFYTTKHESEEREGTGLGLTIVHQIIEEHGGYIEVESEVGRGTTFYINLPTNPHLIRREDQAQTETIPK